MDHSHQTDSHKAESPAQARPRVPHWLRLDNAAKIYPAIRNTTFASVFRVSVTLTEDIDPAILQKALTETIERIPVFAMRLKRGFFWYYLEKNKGTPKVEPDVANPCTPIGAAGNQGFMFRVRYHGRRIALELFHVIADGTGALIFLKTLAGRYLQLKGYAIEPGYGMLDVSDPPTGEEMEDAFAKYARFDAIASRFESRAYHIRGTAEPAGTLRIITGVIPVDRALKEAREHKASLTEFLTAVYILALHKLQKAEQHFRDYDVKVCVPINLRNFYPSGTLRNFALYINPGIDPRYGDYTLDEIVDQVHYFMRLRLNDKFLNAQMCANVHDECNPIMRAVPLFIKNFVMNLAFFMVGESRFSVTLSNLGAVMLPETMRPFVERFDFLLGPGKINRSNATAISYGGNLVINFTRTIRETFVEREFFTQLIRMGIPVLVESNDS